MNRTILLILFFLFTIGQVFAEDAVYFADPNLKQCVIDDLAALDPPIVTSDPTPADMLKLISLNAINCGITDLTGLEEAHNLEYLYLYSNRISDISELSGLTNLEELDLRNNPLNQEACDIHIPQIISNNPDIDISHDPCISLTIFSTTGGEVLMPGEGEFSYVHS